MAYVIYLDQCTRCGLCQKECPMQAILLEEGIYRIDPDICTECGYCSDICPAEAIRGM
jgi:ferredoxin